MKKVNIFCHSFQKGKPIYYIDSIFQAFISWNFDDYDLQITKTQNSVSRKIWILHKINKKGHFKLKSQFISMHSILGLISAVS